jgi:branched-chain amino acid transport system ATP-binding protein/branched-chain amino acid transport system permease protein
MAHLTAAPIARARWLPELATAVALIAAPPILSHLGFVPDTMSRILVLGLFGIGFDLLFGYTGLLSFGQAAFFGTGGFTAAYLLTRLGLSSVMLSLALGILAAAVCGVAVGLIALRRTGIYFAMITVAIAQVFFFLENSPLADFTGGENGLPGVPAPTFSLGFATLPIHSGWSMYGFIAACYFVGLLVARRIVQSPIGCILAAIRDNPLRAAAVGHDVHGYKLLIFVIAAAYSGLAGGLLGVLQGYMPPDAFSFDTSGQLVMQTVIGGAGTLYGPLVGAAVWLYLRDFLQESAGLGAQWKLVLGVIFVLLVCFLRRGIIGGLKDLLILIGRRPGSTVERGGAVHTGDGDGVPAAPARRPDPPLMPPLRAACRTPGPILTASALTKRYGGLIANNNIHFAVEQGEMRGVIGPNGAGKSTFFKMLTCEVAPTSGSIAFEGKEITGMQVTDVCQLGLTKSYQVSQLFTRLTVRENLTIAALASLRGKLRIDLLKSPARVRSLHSRVDGTLELVDLTERCDVPAAALAYGEKRRLEIGLALATAPSLLLLDEPLSGMSPMERIETVKLLKSIARDRTLIIIDHDMDSLFELTERITVLERGCVLAEGTPLEIKNNPAVQEAYLGPGSAP